MYVQCLPVVVFMSLTAPFKQFFVAILGHFIVENLELAYEEDTQLLLFFFLI